MYDIPLFVEVCTLVTLRSANLKPLVELGKHVGFRSVYMFDEEDASVIRYNGHSRGFQYFDLYSDCLFVDIDIKTPEEKARAVSDVKRLKDMGIKFEVWSSGNRSVHLHIPHALMHSRHLPYTHQCVVEKLGIACDMSIYRGNSLYRLPHTKHQKSGKYKVLLNSYEGKMLSFPIFQTPEKQKLGDGPGEMKLDAELVFYTLHQACMEEPEQRYMRVFSLSCLLFDMGLGKGNVHAMLSMVNNFWPEPTDDSNVDKAVEGGFTRVRGG